MDEPRVAHVAHDDQDREDRPCYCYGSGVVVLQLEEDGQERDEVVPCRRCSEGL